MAEICFLKYMSPGMLEELVHVLNAYFSSQERWTAQCAQQHQTAENEEEEEGLGLFPV